MKFIGNLIKQPALILIRIYQKLFSFDHSFWAKPEKFRLCIYYPSCSEYTYQAIDKFGLIKGSILGAFRVIRCNPIAQGGIDEVPKKFSDAFKKPKGQKEQTNHGHKH